MSLNSRIDGGRMGDHRIGPGALILVCGPSGAGKDALLSGARTAIRDTGDVLFARRVVSRPVSESEDHDSVSIDEFARMRDRGEFAFYWSAHGLEYGVRSSINDALRSGRCVICNTSRTIIARLRDRYVRTVVVLVTAPPDILAQRLALRARTTDGAIDERVARSARIANDFKADIVIENIGAIDDSIRKLCSAIERELLATAHS